MLVNSIKSLLVTLAFASLSLLATAALAQPTAQPIGAAQAPAAAAAAAQAPAPAHAHGNQTQIQAPAAAHAHGNQAHGFQVGGAAVGRAAVANPNQTTVARLQTLLNDMARTGQTPANSPLMADINRLVNQYSAKPKSTVKVSNFGPGHLKIVNADGTFSDLQPNWSIDVVVSGSQIDLVAEHANATIELQHAKDHACRYWDTDDRHHTAIGPAAFPGAAPQQHRFTLTRNTNGYHLEP